MPMQLQHRNHPITQRRKQFMPLEFLSSALYSHIAINCESNGYHRLASATRPSNRNQR